MHQYAIADQIGVNKSTISREFKRNTGLRGYRPKQAHRLACSRQARIRRTRISDVIWTRIEEMICEELSPEQITGHLKYIGEPSVSPEWIYQHNYADKRNGGNRLTRLVTLRHNRRPIFSCTLHRLLTLKAIPIIKHQITSKNSGGQNLTSDQNPIPWAVRTAYGASISKMTISITAKDKDTFPVVVQTTSTTTHTVKISDPIHINLTGGSIPKEAFCLSQKNSIKLSDDRLV